MGVVVVEDVTPSMALSAWVMDTNDTVTITAEDPIPLGHKIALATIEPEATVIKYGQDIGRAVAKINPGSHVHVHNLKTKRW